MDTQQAIVRTERVDDIPLLLAQMHKIRLAEVIDEHFKTHGNWQGLSIGQITCGWLSYLLSEGDHRMNHVERWAGKMPITLSVGLQAEVRALDFSDDRLSAVLDEFSGDEDWESFERTLNGRILRVYDLKAERVRIDTTTAKSYVDVTADGLLQFGHSKDHRPDVPQLKISQSTLDPLGLPVTTTVVSGHCADEPLYIPEIKRVQSSLNGVIAYRRLQNECTRHPRLCGIQRRRLSFSAVSGSDFTGHAETTVGTGVARGTKLNHDLPPAKRSRH